MTTGQPSVKFKLQDPTLTPRFNSQLQRLFGNLAVGK